MRRLAVIHPIVQYNVFIEIPHRYCGSSARFALTNDSSIE